MFLRCSFPSPVLISTTYVLALSSSFPERSPMLCPQQQINSGPFALFLQEARSSQGTVLSKGVPSKRAPPVTETVLIVTTLSLFLCLFCGTQVVAVRDHVDLRGYVDCSNPSPCL